MNMKLALSLATLINMSSVLAMTEAGKMKDEIFKIFDTPLEDWEKNTYTSADTKALFANFAKVRRHEGKTYQDLYNKLLADLEAGKKLKAELTKAKTAAGNALTKFALAKESSEKLLEETNALREKITEKIKAAANDKDKLIVMAEQLTRAEEHREILQERVDKLFEFGKSIAIDIQAAIDGASNELSLTGKISGTDLVKTLEKILNNHANTYEKIQKIISNEMTRQKEAMQPRQIKK